VLVFADQLTRTWKQIIKFRPEGEQPKVTARAELPALQPPLDETAFAAMEGVRREERGLVFEREESD
jgi:cyanophycin synthetase